MFRFKVADVCPHCRTRLHRPGTVRVGAHDQCHVGVNGYVLTPNGSRSEVLKLESPEWVPVCTACSGPAFSGDLAATPEETQ